MSKLQYPQSDPERRLLLDSLAENKAKNHLSPSVLNEILALNDPFQKQLDGASLFKYQYTIAIEQHQENIKTLEIYIHAFQMEIILRSQQYEWANQTYVDFFNLENHPSDNDDVKALLSTAETLLAGEEQAVAAGFLPMTKPSHEDLDNKRQAVARSMNRIKGAKADLDYAESMLTPLREAADQLFERVDHFLDTVLQKMPAEEIKQIKSGYGFHFVDDI